MTEPPEPMTPPECDLRGLPFMPLDVVRLIDSDLFALSSGDEFKAAVALWSKSWLQVPAGSLPDDDRILAHLSVAGSRWPKVRGMALRGWVKCSDGRLYHGVIAPKACDAWKARLAQRARATKRWSGIAAASADASSDAKPDNSHGDAAAYPTAHADADAAAMQGRGTVKEDTSSLRSLAEPPPDLDPSKAFFAEAKPALSGLLGKPIAAAGQALGRLRAAYGHDDLRLLEQIRAAVADPPADAMSWLMARKTGLTVAKPARQSPCLNDPPEAWASLVDRIEEDDRDGEMRPVVNGFYVDITARELAQLVGLAWDWRGDWQTMIGWMREGLDPDKDIIPAIRRVVSRPGYQRPSTLRYFDQAVRAAA